MADSVDLKVVGLPEFITRLRALSFDMQKKIVRAGASAAGTIFKKAAAAGAPVLKKPDTRKKNPRIAGQLKKAIYGSRNKFKSKAGVEVFTIGARAGGKDTNGKPKPNTAFYARFVELGHIARGPGQKIKGGTRRAALERTRLKAAGAKQVPGVLFLKNAFKANQDAAIKAFNLRIEARIKKAQKELNVR